LWRTPLVTCAVTPEAVASAPSVATKASLPTTLRPTLSTTFPTTFRPTLGAVLRAPRCARGRSCRFRPFTTRATLAALMTMTATVTPAAATVTSMSITEGALRAAIRARLCAFRAARRRGGGAVEGPVVPVGALGAWTLRRWIKVGRWHHGLRPRHRLRNRLRVARGLCRCLSRRISGGIHRCIGLRATRGTAATWPHDLVRCTSRCRWCYGWRGGRRSLLPRRGRWRRRRRGIAIGIVVPSGFGGWRGTGATAANWAFAFGHSKTASGTVGSVPIWKGARGCCRHWAMPCIRPEVRDPDGLTGRVPVTGSRCAKSAENADCFGRVDRAVALAGKAKPAFRYHRGCARDSRLRSHGAGRQRTTPHRPTISLGLTALCRLGMAPWRRQRMTMDSPRARSDSARDTRSITIVSQSRNPPIAAVT
jgi:hypothetical protein